MAVVMIRSVGPAPWHSERLENEVEAVFSQMAPALVGKLVLLKPNLVVSSPGDAGIITHPELIRAVVRVARRRGARVLVGDNPGGVEGNSTMVASACGVLDAAEGAFVNLAGRVVEVPSRSKYSDTFVLPRLLFDADFVINLPIFKTHLLTTITGAIKNCFGYVAGAGKSQLHLKAPSRRRFSELLVDVYAQRPPDLHILDALTVMDGDGPTHGRVREFGMLLASVDGVALDATMARLGGVDPRKLHTLVAAAKRGLGSLDDVELDGEWGPIPDFLLPTTFAASPEEQVRLLTEVSCLHPTLRPEDCVQCGDCAANCPAHAISLDPHPRVGKSCIACFCCAELCPTGAMQAPTGKIRSAFDRMF